MLTALVEPPPSLTSNKSATTPLFATALWRLPGSENCRQSFLFHQTRQRWRTELWQAHTHIHNATLPSTQEFWRSFVPHTIQLRAIASTYRITRLDRQPRWSLCPLCFTTKLHTWSLAVKVLLLRFKIFRDVTLCRLMSDSRRFEESGHVNITAPL